MNETRIQRITAIGYGRKEKKKRALKRSNTNGIRKRDKLPRLCTNIQKIIAKINQASKIRKKVGSPL